MPAIADLIVANSAVLVKIWRSIGAGTEGVADKANAFGVARRKESKCSPMKRRVAALCHIQLSNEVDYHRIGCVRYQPRVCYGRHALALHCF